jgi:hypothetical protein
MTAVKGPREPAAMQLAVYCTRVNIYLREKMQGEAAGHSSDHRLHSYQASCLLKQPRNPANGVHITDAYTGCQSSICAGPK